ncbi:MAG TPA: class F sortase [Candidatus Paceibacterota bacterium]|nr:class F sortase [Candidatus Paceibacterota bacterium]
MNRFTPWLIGAATLIAGVVFVTTFVHAVYYAPDTEAPPSPSLASAAASIPSAVKPVRLIVPALGIDANVQQLGINAKGAMMAPSNFTDVGWYRYGTVPGHVGSAVIDGHVDNGLGLDGVFKHLGDVQKGDDIYIEDQNGKKLHFIVDDVQIYPFDASPAQKIFGQTDSARLNLITCAGTWVKGQRTYNERLVVYSKLAPS